MDRVDSIADLRHRTKLWRLQGETIALVPTMGNLHQGHLQLVKAARRCADRVVVSIFVNPTQFSAGEDFSSYPRTEQADRQKLIDRGTDLLFIPTIEAMYPNASSTVVTVQGLSDLHCGKSRPGHFGGVATVVCKLFNLVQPDVAFFGRKDYQQLAVIRRMVADLNIPVAIRSVATMRETDGLAMSSRNAYLSPEQRTIAPLLFRSLQEAKQMLYTENDSFAAIEQRQCEILRKAGFVPDYFTICRADNLQPVVAFDTDLVILAAAKLGQARLIDNIEVPLNREKDQ